MERNCAKAKSRTPLIMSEKSIRLTQTIVIAVVIICLGLIILQLILNIQNNINFI